MKKKIQKLTALCLSVLLIGAMASGCNKKEDEEESSSNSPSQSTVSESADGSTGGQGRSLNSVNYWLGNLKDAETVLMDSAAIAEYNRKLTEDSATNCVDLQAYPETLSKEELSGYLNEIAFPSDDRYIGDTKATQQYYDTLVQNMNKDGVGDSAAVRYGYISDNTLMRTFPTADPSYEIADDEEFDFFTETMLKVWEPVALLHPSKDQKWWLAQSGNYRGWISAQDVAEVKDRSEWETYLNPANPLVITGNRVVLNENIYNSAASGKELFMGTVLPMLGEGEIPSQIDRMSTGSGFAVLLPARREDGSFQAVQALVPWNADVREGYLPYTRGQVLRQAFKLLGDRHGWSGMNKSRDASSLVMDIFQTFGIRLPRNSAQQQAAPGAIVDLKGLDDTSRKEKLAEASAGSILTMDGHVAVYLGQSDGTPYALHSLFVVYDSAKTEQMINAIAVTDLSVCTQDGSSYLSALTGIKTIGNS